LYDYLQSSHSENHELNMPKDLIDMALKSDALLAIIPMQDILALDSTNRMNVPGTSTGNWHWRFNWQQLSIAQQVGITTAILDSRRSE
jgi:4-alpha-glucanotransferase